MQRRQQSGNLKDDGDKCFLHNPRPFWERGGTYLKVKSSVSVTLGAVPVGIEPTELA
ncbi:hypothetical protein Xkoz_01174 [Xenorhabdus kozodoii]|uniref:Uncharacterized protein n=1 Tax=Xenorhabdus kozodoii TaxID=351676 RepID=A0A2D0LE89_9GAMM|nr:hypothetical protein Xkoz_01174 [Xenorhabdus kozodoii]